MLSYIENIISATFFIGLFFVFARQTASAKQKIKKRANEEYVSSKNINTEDLQKRLAESELMYEELERERVIVFAFLAGLLSLHTLNEWYWALLSAVIAGVLADKYLSVKPFTNDISDFGSDDNSIDN